MSPQATTIKKNSARDLRLVTVGQGVSLVGDAITTLALPIVAVASRSEARASAASRP